MTQSQALRSALRRTRSTVHRDQVEAGAVPEGVTVFDDHIPAVAGLNPELLAALRRAAADAAADGIAFYVNSGWRAPEYQAELLRKAVAKHGSAAAAARWVATPETSAHVAGAAVDIGRPPAAAWLSEHGARYGLCQIYRNEPWHFELRPEAVTHGCPPMYADPSQDPRMWRSTSPTSASAVAPAVVVYGCGPDEAELFDRAASSFGVAVKIINEPLTTANAELAGGSRCVSVGHKTAVSRSVLRELGRLGVRYLSTRSIGSDHIDTEYARGVGITVGTVAYSPDGVADHTLLLMLMAVRQVRSLIRRVDVRDYRLIGPPGPELRDLTVGVVGTGRIGSTVIKRLHGFGSKIITHDIRSTDRNAVGLDELLRSCDIVTLHTPLAPDTHHLLDHERIAHLKRGSYVVNTGRGALIDTEALLHALESGHLAGAALDVIEGEQGVFYADCHDRPIDGSALARLQGLPNVVITPHTAYYTDHALDDIVRETMINCLTFGQGDQHD